MIEERLLVLLRTRANDRGTLSISAATLAQGADASAEEVHAAIGKLERAGFLRVLAPLPFLVIKLRSWSDAAAKSADSRASAYSYSSSTNRLNESYRQPDDALLQEILTTLGETDPESFVGAVRNYSPEVIRKALERVRRARSVRKNRTALFRFLLGKLS